MVPNTIHDVVMARIDRLPDETKRLLQTAAVIGREFPLRLLNAVWKGPGSVEDQLRELSRLEFVYERVETEGSVYVFRHALTQETAYGSLLERHRRAYHGAVGHALEELYSGRTDEVAELLALHFGRSNEAEKSVDYAILAGREIAAPLGQQRGADLFQRCAAPPRPAARHRSQPAAPHRRRDQAGRGQIRARPARRAHRRPSTKFAVSSTRADDPRRRATWHYWRGFLHILTGGRPRSRSITAARRRRSHRPPVWTKSEPMPNPAWPRST